MNSASAILKLVDLVALGAGLAPDILARYREVSASVKAMVEEGRDPTPREWAELDAETNRLLDDIANS